ncbi:MAG TPA: serine hydrolase domain-containing protein [Pyrinomonadaceae bacterium]|nr:serine hydrolase domain-containing protein [Pyrinomonadaceae bacterium]
MKSKSTPFRLLFVLVLLFLTYFVRADEVDKFVQSQLAEKHIPGAAIVVVKNGKIIKSKGYGLASVEFNVPVTPETVFEIGSVSKQLTAAGILLLMEDGKLNLDEKISKYLPNTPATWEKVTVRNLLTHTSGIKSYSSLEGFNLSKRLKQSDFIKALAPYPLDFETGTNYTYSNSGFNLLAFIIESVSGKSYWEFMRQRIFIPLGMTKTADRDPQFIIANRATGYEWRDNRLVGRDYELTDLFGAGSIVSTVLDLAKWDAALRNDTLLKKETKAEMWKPLTFNDGKTYPYGLAWRISDIRGHKLIAHSGQTAGFGASVSRFVDDDLTVIALTNLGESGMGTLIAQGVAKILIPSMSLKQMKAQPEPDSKLTQMISTALRERFENKFNPDVLTQTLINSLSTERSKLNTFRIALFGNIKKFTFVGSETNEKTKIYRYKAEAEKRIFLWRFAIGADGKISEMTLEEEE